MSERKFYTPEEISLIFDEIIPVYQSAFAGDPWYEVSKCPDKFQRCVGGLSPLAVGSICELCDLCTIRPAYEADELKDRFEAVSKSRQTTWYTERSEEGMTLAAVAWQATATIVETEKYGGNTEMRSWLQNRLGDRKFMWLDEVFADKDLKPKGNLQNFGTFVTGLANILETDFVAYRTIEPRMLVVAQRDFGSAATIFSRDVDVPDRRDFVIINLGKEQ